MMDLLTIALEAHSDERNRHRRYEVSVGRDLLDDWVVTVRYGRVGTPLREVRFGGPELDHAQTVVHERLQRRLSARKRIGCAYQLRELVVRPPISLPEWVPVSALTALSETGATGTKNG